MQIVLATHSLKSVGGSETYVVTVAEHLQRLGHDVWLHAGEHGRSTAAAERLGLRVAAGEHELPPHPDALVVQDGVVACEMALRYPGTAQVYVAHSDVFDLQLPPQLPDLVAVVVVLYDRVEQRIRALAQPVEIVRLTQPIDVERFKPTVPLRARARVALALGNYMHGQRLELLARACRRARIELRHVGQWAAEGERPATLVLNEADIVFGKARVIHEAMACGRAAYVFDHNGGDGWVTGDNYGRLVADNFGGQSLPGVIDEDRLVADLAAYDAGMGVVNRDLIVANHAATEHAARIVAIIGDTVPRAAPVAAPLRELARLIRLNYRADGEAFVLRTETERLGALVQRLEAELDSARGEAAGAAAESARLAQQLRGLTATRRWRAMQAALAPADRLRGRLAGPRGADKPPPREPPARGGPQG